jgi:hypothetical protein
MTTLAGYRYSTKFYVSFTKTLQFPYISLYEVVLYSLVTMQKRSVLFLIPSDCVVDGGDCYIGSSMIFDGASIRHARRRDSP